MKTLRTHVALACTLAITSWTLPASASNTLVVSGDEWQLGNQAYGSATTGPSTQALVANIAGLFGGTNYLLVTNDAVYMPPSNLTSLQSQLGALGKTATFASSFNAPADLVGVDAVMFFGRGPGSGSYNAGFLTPYIQGGGNVYVSLGTGAFGSPAGEAAAWNPLLNAFGLNATSIGWFDFPGFADVPVVGGGSPLDVGVSSLLWGYGQAVTELVPSDPNTSLLSANFGSSGVLGAMAVAHPVPEPGTWALMFAGLGLVGATARRRS